MTSEFRCPHCHAPIYSRRSKVCGVCEKPLPPELLFSAPDAALLKEQMNEEEKRAKSFDPNIHHTDGGIGI